jgi:hypothetical protein
MLELSDTCPRKSWQNFLTLRSSSKLGSQETGPQNDDELHEWLKFELGIDVPRVAVCEDHRRPSTF